MKKGERRKMDLNKLVRKNILALKPYSCARDEFQGEASVYLDANESPYNQPYNRYPDPLQRKVKEKIARIKGVRPGQIMLGNGSDEPIDLLIRIFCEPGKDNIVTIDPSYGMYQVCADISDVECRKALLDENYDLDADALLAATDDRTKLIFLCSPNNPSGNLLNSLEIRKVLKESNAIVVIDEAYIDFAPGKSWLRELDNSPNLVILQTFSKAWGLASIRCGMAFSSEEIIAYFNKVKYPYNLNILTQEFILDQLSREKEKEESVALILEERPVLEKALGELPLVEKVYPSDANFLLVKVRDANIVYNQLADEGVVVRNRNKISLCENCLRVTVGTKDENQMLIKTLKELNV
jgi:histidinol-phosphate aminotransferase